MTKLREMPVSGYSIERVYSLHQRLEHQDPETGVESSGLDIGWDWRILEGPDVAFEVKMSATVSPSPERDDLIAADVIGHFRLVEENPSVPVSQFVRLQAVAILLPYLRQVLTNLTIMSFHGAYYLPSVNVVELVKDFNPADAIGARQLRRFAEDLHAEKSLTTSDDEQLVATPTKKRLTTKPPKTRKKSAT